MSACTPHHNKNLSSPDFVVSQWEQKNHHKPLCQLLMVVQTIGRYVETYDMDRNEFWNYIEIFASNESSYFVNWKWKLKTIDGVNIKSKNKAHDYMHKIFSTRDSHDDNLHKEEHQLLFQIEDIIINKPVTILNMCQIMFNIGRMSSIVTIRHHENIFSYSIQKFINENKLFKMYMYVDIDEFSRLDTHENSEHKLSLIVFLMNKMAEKNGTSIFNMKLS
jgi:hypothetical protein